jgi:hypothetical protein
LLDFLEDSITKHGRQEELYKNLMNYIRKSEQISDEPSEPEKTKAKNRTLALYSFFRYFKPDGRFHYRNLN